MNAELDWTQILIRKVLNIHHLGEEGANINLSGTIGDRCSIPMSYDTPFLLSPPDESFLHSKELFLDNNFICSYKKIEQTPFLLSERCMLDLDGDCLDVNLLKEVTIGAFFVNLNKVYAGFSKYNNQITKNIKCGAKLPVCRSPQEIVDLNKFFNLKYFKLKWLYSIRMLKPNIPFGIRIPSNFIEQDLILAVLCDVDFIILDCTDTVLVDVEGSAPMVPSMAAITRAVNILEKLNSDMKIIVGAPMMFPKDCFKLFALGVSLVMINDPKYQRNSIDYLDSELEEINQYSDVEKLDFEQISVLKEKACDQLKKDIQECGCSKLSEISKANLLTSSVIVKNLTNLNTVADPDSVLLPFFQLESNLKKKSLRF